MKRDDASKKEFARSLRRARLNTGWTQADVSRQLGISARTYSDWERGLALPFGPKFFKLAQYFGLTVEQLTGEEPFSESYRPPYTRFSPPPPPWFRYDSYEAWEQAVRSGEEELSAPIEGTWYCWRHGETFTDEERLVHAQSCDSPLAWSPKVGPK